MRFYLINKLKAKGDEGMAYVVEHLRKCKSLSSNPSITRKKKKKKVSRAWMGHIYPWPRGLMVD